MVRLLVEMIEPYEGRVFDPCCGSAGMFVQSVKFIEAHATGNGNGKKALSNLSIYGQESNQTTLRLAKMNLAIRGIDAQIEFGDSFRNDQHPDLRAGLIRCEGCGKKIKREPDKTHCYSCSKKLVDGPALARTL